MFDIEQIYNKNAFQSNANHPLAQQYGIHKIGRTDGRTDRQMDRHTDRQTDTQTDMSENITYLHTRVVIKTFTFGLRYTVIR